MARPVFTQHRRQVAELDRVWVLLAALSQQQMAPWLDVGAAPSAPLTCRRQQAAACRRADGHVESAQQNSCTTCVAIETCVDALLSASSPELSRWRRSSTLGAAARTLYELLITLSIADALHTSAFASGSGRLRDSQARGVAGALLLSDHCCWRYRAQGPSKSARRPPSFQHRRWRWHCRRRHFPARQEFPRVAARHTLNCHGWPRRPEHPPAKALEW